MNNKISEINRKIGIRIRIARLDKKISQEDLADKLQVSRQAVSKWESGTGFPETEKIIAICEVFKCSMDELVKGKISLDVKSEKEEYERIMNEVNEVLNDTDNI